MSQKEQQQREDAIIQAYETELANQQQAMQSQQTYSPTMFNSNQKQNLVEWELDFKAELEDIERLLRCDILARDKDGNEMWIHNPNKELVIFNEIGVNDILREIRMFLNKNKVLSDYGIEEIKVRVRMIGHELRVLIYNNYEHYGMDNEYKQNNYSMVVLTIVTMVEDSYRRALNGRTHKGLGEQRLVTQNESMMPQMQYNMPQMQSSNKSIFKPWTWSKK